MSKKAIIKAEQLNATHLGEKIIILDNCKNRHVRKTQGVKSVAKQYGMDNETTGR